LEKLSIVQRRIERQHLAIPRRAQYSHHSAQEEYEEAEQEELKHEVIASLQSHESPDKSEQTQLLYLAIKSLGEVDRALVMLYLEDLSYKEIADVLGLTEDNVGVKLNRIKSKLRVLIGHIE
jgi:RNA polymerase sigma factor (sigma-70 family)